jgi:tetratricopeptide (TPR) repeat protein
MTAQHYWWLGYVEAGETAESQRRLDHAALWLESALTLAEDFGPEDPRLLRTAKALGRVYHRQGRHEEAHALLLRALAASEQTLGPDHPAVADLLCWLAACSAFQEQHAQAEAWTRRGLALRTQAFGPESREVADSLGRLALYCRAQGRPSEAALHARGSLNICEAISGTDDLWLTESLVRMAKVAERQGWKEEAEQLWERAAAAYERLRVRADLDQAEDRQRVLSGLESALHGLFLAAFRRCQFDHAERVYRQMLTVAADPQGRAPDDRPKSRWRFAYVLRRLGKPEEAEAVLRDVLARPRPEPRLAEVPHAQRVLGDMCADQNRYAEAETLLREAVAAFEKDDTLVRPLAASLRSYASLCRRTGRADEADGLVARAREAEARDGG